MKKLVIFIILISVVFPLSCQSYGIKSTQKEMNSIHLKVPVKELSDEEKAYNVVQAFEEARNTIDYRVVTGYEGLDFYTQRARDNWLNQEKYKELCKIYKMKKENSKFIKIDNFEVVDINKKNGVIKVKVTFSKVVISIHRKLMIQRVQIKSTILLLRENKIWKIDREDFQNTNQ